MPLAVLLVAVFGGLSALHVYWALGGRRGGDVAVPKASETSAALLFKPSVLTGTAPPQVK